MNQSESRLELVSALQSLAGLIPAMRVGQLMAAIGERCTDLHGRGLWDATDAELLEAVWQFRRDFEGATTSRTQAQVETVAEIDQPHK